MVLFTYPVIVLLRLLYFCSSVIVLISNICLNYAPLPHTQDSNERHLSLSLQQPPHPNWLFSGVSRAWFWKQMPLYMEVGATGGWMTWAGGFFGWAIFLCKKAAFAIEIAAEFCLGLFCWKPRSRGVKTHLKGFSKKNGMNIAHTKNFRPYRGLATIITIQLHDYE